MKIAYIIPGTSVPDVTGCKIILMIDTYSYTCYKIFAEDIIDAITEMVFLLRRDCGELAHENLFHITPGYYEIKINNTNEHNPI